MQQLEYLVDLIFMFALIVLYGTVVWGLLRYSKQPKHRYWAVGWVIYSIGALFGALISTSGLVASDIVSLSLMFSGSTLILDGTQSAERQPRPLIYLVGLSLIVVGLTVGLLLEIFFVYIFSLLGLYVAYVCIASAREVSGSSPPMEQSEWWLVGGFLLWASSWFAFPFILVLPIYFNVMLLQAIGVLVTGSAMLTFFLKSVTEDLQSQYQVSQIMSGVIQHDIRNYLQTIRNSLELAESDSGKRQYWLDVSEETVTRAGAFVEEMREIAASMSRPRRKPTELSLSSTIETVRERVATEYSLGDDQICVEVEPELNVLSCGMAIELLWNIMDNAFKHGSSEVLVRATQVNGTTIALEIEDDGSGLPQHVKDFMNAPDSLKRPVPPGLGLGVILIRGLALLCGVHLTVSDRVEDSEVIGTRFQLDFKAA